MAKITLTLTDTLAASAKRAAEKDDRKLSSYIRKAVMEKLNREKKHHAAPNTLPVNSAHSKEGAV